MLFRETTGIGIAPADHGRLSFSGRRAGLGCEDKDSTGKAHHCHRSQDEAQFIG